jgi:lipopolysaccharide transport system ATP-binding protein
MSQTVIKVENLSKLYRLGEVTTGTLSHDLNRWWHKIRGKEDPYARIGQTNDRTRKAESEYVWALKDVNFKVAQGEVLGIIGRNGAGKSTLLKLLSRVTSPTSGSIKIRGRFASLLEVGTGFHPELTGRENIYLNGAILGMSSREITSKLDEIVDFSGCEAYLDTPVKRYSSGMKVRLAFAVAAFLEAEILIIDEVLAVGDGEFQKKCLGKMNDVASQGRTLLFVSHNMGLISSLCSRVVVMEQGGVAYDGPVANGVLTYYSRGKSSPYEVDYQRNADDFSRGGAGLLYASIENLSGDPVPEVTLAQPFNIRMKFALGGLRPRALIPSARLYDSAGNCVFASAPRESMTDSRPGIYQTCCKVDANVLNNGTYFVSLGLAFIDKGVETAFFERDALCFTVREQVDDELYAERNGYTGPIPGVIRPRYGWEIQKPLH